MSAHIATLVYIAAILGLFFLDREPSAQPSKALWIPVWWLLINGSRPISQWLQTGPTVAPIDQYVEGSPLDALFFGILMTAGLTVLIFRRRLGMFRLANLPLFMFLIYCAMSTLWSDYPFVAFKRWTKGVGDVIMVMIVLNDSDPTTAIKRFLSRAAFVLVPLSILLIKYYPDLGRSYNPWTWVPMYGGVTTFKNLLGMTCLVCGLGSFWSFITAYKDRGAPHRIRHLFAHAVLLVMVTWLFWIADSVTSLCCFVLAAGVIALTSQSWVARKEWVVHVSVAAVVVLSLSALFLDPGGSVVQSLGRDPTFTGRTAIWSAAVAVSENPLLGSGFESFWTMDRMQKVFDLSGQHIQEAHNGYLEIYLNLGWIGLGFLAILIVIGYHNVITVFRKDSRAGGIRLGCFVAGVIYSFTEAGFRIMCPVWITFLLATTVVRNAPVLEELTSRHDMGFSPPDLQFADEPRAKLNQGNV